MSPRTVQPQRLVGQFPEVPIIAQWFSVLVQIRIPWGAFKSPSARQDPGQGQHHLGGGILASVDVTAPQVILIRRQVRSRPAPGNLLQEHVRSQAWELLGQNLRAAYTSQGGSEACSGLSTPPGNRAQGIRPAGSQGTGFRLLQKSPSGRSDRSRGTHQYEPIAEMPLGGRRSQS